MISSEAIKGIKLNFAELFMTLASAKDVFFIAVALVLSLLWQLSCHRLIMGKRKTGIYCYFVADILMKVFLEMFV